MQLLAFQAKDRPSNDLSCTNQAGIFAGAKVNTMVKETMTNLASFERSLASDSAQDLTTLDTWGRDHAGHAANAVSKEATHRLVIQPRHDESTDYPHNCPLCPTNLCKVGPSRSG